MRARDVYCFDLHRRFAFRVGLAVSMSAIAAMPGVVKAQDTQTLDEPITDDYGKDVPAVTEDVDYVLPDLRAKRPRDPDKPLPFFKLKVGVSLLGDWTSFDQDEVNLDQIGYQEDTFEFRSARLILSGSVGGDYRVNFQLSGEYKGFDNEAEQNWKLTDASLTFPMGDRTKLTVGKTKETFSYEMVGDSANLPQSERVLSPFFVSRNFGFRLTHVMGEYKLATISVGAYRDAWDFNSSTDRGWDYTARVTGVVWVVPEKRRYLHLGLSYRHAAADETVQYKGRAESNVGDNFVDTGEFAASSADHFGWEALFNLGPFSLLGEYVYADVHSREFNDPNFSGWYVTGSWVLTGETRPYDRNVGYARRVIPKGRWGAPELVARYSEIDLNDNGVNGGEFQKTMLGVNWWATTNWKFSVDWGHTWLDRFGERGEADTVLTRVQWVY